MKVLPWFLAVAGFVAAAYVINNKTDVELAGVADAVDDVVQKAIGTRTKTRTERVVARAVGTAKKVLTKAVAKKAVAKKAAGKKAVAQQPVAHKPVASKSATTHSAAQKPVSRSRSVAAPVSKTAANTLRRRNG